MFHRSSARAMLPRKTGNSFHMCRLPPGQPAQWLWFECNDRDVQPLPPDLVQSRDAYLLFYQRRE
jgi:hypothetical protein